MSTETLDQTRQQWLESRKSAIGASDVAAILGVSPFANAYEVWLDKTDQITDWGGNANTRAGNTFEQAVLDRAEIDLGPLVRNVRYSHASVPMAATLDAQVIATKEPVEAKTTGIEGHVFGNWGEALTDQVPDYYLVQVHSQLLVTGAELGYLFALIAGRGVVKYQIERSDPVCDTIAQVCTAWWDKHVTHGESPGHDELPRLEVVKRFRKIPKKTIVFDLAASSLVDRREQIKAEQKGLGQELEKVDVGILLALGDAEGATLVDGRELTHLEQSRKGFTVEPCKFRSMRIKKGKK